MADAETISVALTPEMAATLHEVVRSGEYASASDVMREALGQWQIRRTERDKATEELGQLWDEGVASGPARDGEAAFARIKAWLDAKTCGRS